MRTVTISLLTDSGGGKATPGIDQSKMVLRNKQVQKLRGQQMHGHVYGKRRRPVQHPTCQIAMEVTTKSFLYSISITDPRRSARVVERTCARGSGDAAGGFAMCDIALRRRFDDDQSL